MTWNLPRLLFAAGALLSGGCAPVVPTPSYAHDRGGPITQIDLGRVSLGGELETYLVYQNTGSSELLIEGLSTSCGCTIATVEKSSVPQGGSTRLRLVADTSSAGSKAAKVTLDVRDGAQLVRETIAELKFAVVPLFRAMPAHPVLSADMQNLVVTVTPSSALAGSWQDVSWGVDSEWVEAVSINSSTDAKIKLAVSPRAPVGSYYVDVIGRPFSDEPGKELRIPVLVQKSDSELTLPEEPLCATGLAPGSTFCLETIVSYREKPLAPRSARSRDSAVSVESLVAGEGGKLVFTLRVAAEQTTSFRSELLLEGGEIDVILPLTIGVRVSSNPAQARGRDQSRPSLQSLRRW